MTFFQWVVSFYNKNVSGSKDRRFNNPAPAADRTDENLPDRIIKFTKILKTTTKKKKQIQIFRFRFSVSLGLVNLSIMFALYTF